MGNRFFLCVVVFLNLVIAANGSALNASDFDRHWVVESESPDYTLAFSGDTCEITAPKGLTLWRKEKMSDGMAVEYDVCIIDKGGKGDRVSDMNCFWLASDPGAADLWQRKDWRQGIFLRCYTLQMYYLGYGGNSNSTTRFRRYRGDSRGVDSAQYRPAILKEYTDKEHLLKGNHWYHIKIESQGNHNRFIIDGEIIVDYEDPEQLKEGWFGFRTTWSHFKITNFKAYKAISGGAIQVPLHWTSSQPNLYECPTTFGIPFAKGEIYDASGISISADRKYAQKTSADGKNTQKNTAAQGENSIPADTWVMARWEDGSVKWAGVAATIPAKQNISAAGTSHPAASKSLKNSSTGPKSIKNSSAPQSLTSLAIEKSSDRYFIANNDLQLFIPCSGSNIIDSILYRGRKTTGAMSLEAVCRNQVYTSNIDSCVIERQGSVSAVVKICGTHSGNGRKWLPFVVRLHLWQGSGRIKITHTFIYNGNENEDNISGIGIKTQVPLHDKPYQRAAAFATENGGVWMECIQPLGGRKRMTPGVDDELISQLAQWDAYRLSCLADNSFAIRKKTTAESPYIGTFTGTHAPGYAFIGDTKGGTGMFMKDFWQTYPSTIEISGARSPQANITMWLWSTEAEPMNLCHYDTVAHGLKAAYEDVQQGMSSPYGIAHTTTLWLIPSDTMPSKQHIANLSAMLDEDPRLLPTPQYLHDKKAFGIWALPDTSANVSAERKKVEQRLNDYLDYYLKAVKERKWYGFWNYGDIMHQYDEERHQWKYDMGGYAWDNTELASPSWLWYSFLRTGRHDIWKMAEAMTRHCSETDTYHIGPYKALGSRHNVTHWGDGAKETRISQAAFNRFYHYLAADERTGDIISEVRDADTLLYHLDPMRLAEPREKFPCNAPARLRLGPDWMAYAGNWLAEWERKGDTRYRDKIITGMKSIASLRHGFFTGNKALGYYPDSGIITYDGDPARQNTNHLITIMGGFEIMNEIMMMTDVPEFNKCWLDFALQYKQKAREISKNHFPVRRLMAYAAMKTGDKRLAQEAWDDLWHRIEHRKAPRFNITTLEPPVSPATLTEGIGITTNDAALWSLDAIYMLEILDY